MNTPITLQGGKFFFFLCPISGTSHSVYYRNFPFLGSTAKVLTSPDRPRNWSAYLETRLARLLVSSRYLYRMCYGAFYRCPLFLRENLPPSPETPFFARVAPYSPEGLFTANFDIWKLFPQSAIRGRACGGTCSMSSLSRPSWELGTP